MNPFVAEYKRYKTLLENALKQLSDENFFNHLGPADNSVAVILKHLSGNFISRFTDFLNTDGEKTWRNRETEFKVEESSRNALEKQWQAAWKILKQNVFTLGHEDMQREVKIRGVRFTVHEALTRSLAHFSFHVGQVVFLAKHFAGPDWQYLTIPPGQSEQYNANPDLEKGFETKKSGRTGKST